MRQHWLRCVVLSVGVWITPSAALLAQDGQPIDIAAERLRIAQERARHEAIFAQAEIVCYRRFAVFDCLQIARQNRRAALDDLRRQELVLNDEDRKRAAVQTLQRIEDKYNAQRKADPTP